MISGAKRKLLARSAMAMAQRGEEPTYPALVAANPKALLNPATGEPVDKKNVYDILRAECYDDDDDPDPRKWEIASWKLREKINFKIDQYRSDRNAMGSTLTVVKMK